ncbi:MAG TPA: collagen-binding domain-containing protein [Planctomycetota bacterium]|nr:collagen-binding domain-containing protein [Planctomycetota bacterium]
MLIQQTPNRGGRRAGGALVMVAFATAVMATLSFSVLALSMAGIREQRTSKEQMSARYVCEAALSEAVFELSKGNDGALGSAQAPLNFDRASYWVESAPLPGQMTRLVATGEVDRAGERIEMTVQEVNESLYVWGAFGDLNMTLSSNARVDSYDATLGTYASQAVNSDGSNTFAGTNGDVGSNNDVDLSQNVKIWGDALPGPSGATNIAGSNVKLSGSTTPMATAVPFPPIEVPAIASTGNLEVTGAGGLVLPPGDYHFDAFVVKSEVTITGPARVVIEDFRLRSNSKFLVDDTLGPVELYVIHDFILDSNTFMGPTSYLPKSLEVYLLSDNFYDPEVIVELDTVDFSSNTKFYGTIYAPDTNIEIDSNLEIFGALVARQVTVASNAQIHFDESLATSKSQGATSWQIVAWRLVQYQP